MPLYSSWTFFGHCLSLGLEWKPTFSSLVVTAEFSKFAGILSAALLTATSFRISNSSAGILSPPLALLIVMLLKAHLTSHSRISGSRWVTTPPWLSGTSRLVFHSWFKIEKGVCQGCILSPFLFNLYAGYIMRNTGLEEAQAGIKITGRNINDLRYADHTTLMAESKK